MFIDTSNINEIEAAIELGIISGITTNPTILSKGKINEKQFVSSFKNDITVPIYFQVLGLTSSEQFEYYRNLRDTIDGEFGIKIPVTWEGLKTIKKIKESDKSQKILGTVIYTASQAILACEAKCDYIAPYYNRIENEGGNAIKLVEIVRNYINKRSLGTKIMAASFKNSAQVVSALDAGAHTCTLPYDILVSMLSNKSVTQDLITFESEKKYD